MSTLSSCIPKGNAGWSVGILGGIDIAYWPGGPTVSDAALKSVGELTLLGGLKHWNFNGYDGHYGAANRRAINTQFTQISGASSIYEDFFCSSTQLDDVLAWNVDFTSGHPIRDIKDVINSVRVVSDF